MNQINHSDLSRPVYDKIKSMILSNELHPGQKIIQEKLASELGVSRTPLNKALQLLEFEMLVESIPRKGVYVKEINIEEMLEVFDCREGLEAVAARLAASKNDPSIAINLKKIFAPFISNKKSISSDKYRLADEKFHYELIKSSGNQLLRRLYRFDNLSDKIIHMGLVRPPEETLNEHLKIIEAIGKNEPELAVYEVIKHIRKSRELIAAALLEKNKITIQ
jgi:DNA-binding GntR family transcriptional regulator